MCGGKGREKGVNELKREDQEKIQRYLGMG
jgi:hypothetical protein